MMSSFSRMCALAFGLLLTCLSLPTGRQEALILSLATSPAAEQLPLASLSEKQPYHSWGIHQSELVVGSINCLPVPASKIHPNDFLSSSYSLELSIRNYVSDFLSLVKNHPPGLAVGTIIFPFHYFW